MTGADVQRRKTILVRTCAQDLHFCRLLIRRIAHLGGWRAASRLAVYTDDPAFEPQIRSMLAAEAPPALETATLSGRPGQWQSARTLAALRAYQSALAFGDDVVRLDPDLFVVSSEFFDRISMPFEGFAGRAFRHGSMLFHGRPVEYIQGGVTCVGPLGRRFLDSLRPETLAALLNAAKADIEFHPAPKAHDSEQFLRKVEDLTLTGVLADEASVPRQNVPGLQLSPYDVLHRAWDSHWSAADFHDAFAASGALAYHYESGGEARRSRIHSHLLWAYEEAGEALA